MICAHPDREEIERDFVSWKSPIQIATDYGIADRSSVYRHARALSLEEKRDRNLRAALAGLIERGGSVEVSSP